MSRPLVSLVAIVARNGGIGRDNALLMRLPEDLAHFKRTTMGAPVIMGRKTWESIGRPLPGRRNIVVSRDPAFAPSGAESAASVEAALARLDGVAKAFVIGGAQIYAAALPLADELVLTEIDAELEADTYFPLWDRRQFRQTARHAHLSAEGVPFSIATYIKNRGD